MELMMKNKCNHLKRKILWHLSENFLTHPHTYARQIKYCYSCSFDKWSMNKNINNIPGINSLFN